MILSPNCTTSLMPLQTGFGGQEVLKRQLKSLNFWESLSTLTQKSTHTNFHGTYPCTKTHPKNQTRYTAEKQLLCCIYFKLFASTNHIFLFSNKQTREYTPEEVAMIERASQDNAIKRALKLEATKVSTALHQMIPTNLVIVRCLRTGYLFVKQI